LSWTVGAIFPPNVLKTGGARRCAELSSIRRDEGYLRASVRRAASFSSARRKGALAQPGRSRMPARRVSYAD
jgi:hypothetical protein